MKAQAQSDVGRSRDSNEDCVLADPELGLIMVADGMGGHAGGEVASGLAVEAIAAWLRDALPRVNGAGPEGISQALRDAVSSAHARLLARVEERPDLAGMGSTVVVACERDSVLHIANVGDSRAYLFRKGVLHQLTQDHSVTAEMVRAGQISERQARTHHLHNYLTRSLGQQTPRADVQTIGWQAGDCVLLCSDGLTNMLDDRKIARIMANGGGSLKAMCTELIRAANSKGGKDNISVVVACPD